MGNKTRRKGQKRRTTRRRGGAIDKLPDVKDTMTLPEFESEYDVFYIRAHGGLLSKTFSVPRNTYLLHSVPSTLSCFLPVDDVRLDRFYKPEDRFNASNSYGIIEPGERDDHFMQFIKNPKSFFEYTYSKNNLSRFHRRRDDRFKEDGFPERTSIYEPLDTVNDVILQFYSHSVVASAEGGVTHFIAPGIFKIPISNNIKKLRDDYLAQIARLRSAPHIDSELQKVDRHFISNKENLLHSIANKDKYTVKLSELLSMPQLQPAPGKKRLVIIHACRSTDMSNADKKIVRAKSVNRILASEAAREAAVRAAAAAPPPPVASVAAAVAAGPVAPARRAQDPLAKSLPGLVGMFASKPKRPNTK